MKEIKRKFESLYFVLLRTLSRKFIKENNIMDTKLSNLLFLQYNSDIIPKMAHTFSRASVGITFVSINQLGQTEQHSIEIGFEKSSF